MTPQLPLLLGRPEWSRVEYAKYQQDTYRALPAWRKQDGTVLTWWILTWRERLHVLWHGTLWLTMKTFNTPLQPVKLEATLMASELARTTNQQED